MNNALAKCLSATEHVSSHQYDKCRYSCFNCHDHVIAKTHLCLAWGNINVALILTNQFIHTPSFIWLLLAEELGVASVGWVQQRVKAPAA